VLGADRPPAVPVGTLVAALLGGGSSTTLGGTDMTAPKPALVTFGTWLRVKRNFYLFFILGTGIPTSLVEVWLTREYVPGVLWIFF
jgi:hypothetical protein